MTNITISEPQNMPHCHSLCEVAGAQTPHRCRYAEDDYARAHLVRLHVVAVEHLTSCTQPSPAGHDLGGDWGAMKRNSDVRSMYFSLDF